MFICITKKDTDEHEEYTYPDGRFSSQRPVR
jgi:hypothetical protein